jgi:hypothetical protein
VLPSDGETGKSLFMQPIKPIEHALETGSCDSEEELEDIPIQDKMCNPFLGVSITRQIEGVSHEGRVEDIERGRISKGLLYRIKYQDGDLEHFTSAQVSVFRVP